MTNATLLTGLTECHLQLLPSGFKLHQQVVQPFQALHQAAARDGIDIQLVSAYRSYQRQAAIWQAKYHGERPVYDRDGNEVPITSLAGKARLDAILLYSALPGCSRHHWGTDLDIYDAAAVPKDYKPQLEPAEYDASGPFYRLRLWLEQHGENYGFFLPYRQYQGGVAAEPWHLSFRAIASQYLHEFTVDTVRHAIEMNPIAGQSLVLKHLDSLFEQYVCTICD